MREKNDASHQAAASNSRAIRLTFSYQGEEVKLVKQQALNMLPPPSSELKTPKNAAGFWLEVLDQEQKTAYRRAMQNPIRHYAEVRSDNPDQPLEMQEIKDPKGIFTILIPELDRAAEVVLFSSPFKPKKKLEPAVEIARFKLGGRKNRKEG